MNQFESLIADFAKMTGLPLSPDERGGCALETDGLIITIQYRAEADDIVIFAPVADPEAPLPHRIWRRRWDAALRWRERGEALEQEGARFTGFCGFASRNWGIAFAAGSLGVWESGRIRRIARRQARIARTEFLCYHCRIFEINIMSKE